MALQPPKIATLNEGDEGFAGLCECGYNTRGWPKAGIASERIQQHLDEHVSYLENEDDPSKWKLMEPLEDFRGRHGLMQSEVSPNLAVFPEGAKEVKPKRTRKPKEEPEPAETAEEGSE